MENEQTPPACNWLLTSNNLYHEKGQDHLLDNHHHHFVHYAF